MRRTVFLLGSVFALAAGCTSRRPDPAPPDWTPGMQAAADASNRFAFDLYGKLRGSPGNLFFSPISVHTALAMTATGAGGRTRDELVKVLHVPAGDGLPAVGDLWRHTAHPRADYELSLANAVWGQKGVAWRHEWLAAQADRFGAALKEADFARDPDGERRRVNDWVGHQTHDKIKDLLGAGSVTPDSRLVLANAVYFKGRWEEPFKPSATRDAPFTLTDGSTVSVPMMNRDGGFRYAREPGFQVAELPYKGGELAMVLLVPDTHDGLPGVERRLSADAVAGWVGRARGGKSMSLVMPRFRMELSADLTSHLRALGMAAAFQKGASDFSAMSDEKLHVGSVHHKAFVDVREEGTEAAAATAVTFQNISGPLVTVCANRPFVFLIRDTKRGTVLFLGRVEKP